MHVQACILYSAVVGEQTWVPPTDFGDIQSDIFVSEEGLAYRYFKMMYHSTLIYAMVDISTRGEYEIVVLSMLIIVMAIINAIVFGQFAVQNEQLQADANEYMDKLSLVNSVMNEQKIPMEM